MTPNMFEGVKVGDKVLVEVEGMVTYVNDVDYIEIDKDTDLFDSSVRSIQVLERPQSEWTDGDIIDWVHMSVTHTFVRWNGVWHCHSQSSDFLNDVDDSLMETWLNTMPENHLVVRKQSETV